MKIMVVMAMVIKCSGLEKKKEKNKKPKTKVLPPSTKELIPRIRVSQTF